MRTAPWCSLAGVALLVLSGCRLFGPPAPTASSIVVTGIVLAPDSSVVPNALVATMPPSQRVAAGPDGRFRLDEGLTPGVYTVYAEHPTLTEGADLPVRGLKTDVALQHGDAVRVVIMLREERPFRPIDSPLHTGAPADGRGKLRTGG